MNPIHNLCCFPNQATPPGSATYYSVRFAPSQSRSAVALLFAWKAELRRIIFSTTDAGIARLKLQWWREELARSFAQEAQHPLGQQLTEIIHQYQLPLTEFVTVIDGVEAELRQPYPDLASLRRHGRESTGALFALAARCCGAVTADQSNYVHQLGEIVRLIEIISAVGSDLRSERCYLPLSLLDQYQLSLYNLRDPSRQSQFVSLLTDLHDIAKQWTAETHLATDQMTSSLIVARIQKVLALATLAEIERSHFLVLNQAIHLTPLRQFWLAWRESRKRS